MATSPAGYSGTPLPRKLGIKPGQRVATLSAPPHFPALLGDLPLGVRVEAEPSIPRSLEAAGARAFDVVVAFVRDQAELERRLPAAQRLLAWDGGLWIAWPKGSSPLASDLREDGVRSRALPLGLVDNKVCAVDQDWSGLRLVYRKENRPPPSRAR